ncbi:MAG: hypothetical protein IPI81_00890 [Flavobacteriales bacterium]|nr:hypothetical protein [Flavobacteriales bacterium]MCC6939508.1 hypothetical protein [Flavobacteriales bacterium]
MQRLESERMEMMRSMGDEAARRRIEASRAEREDQRARIQQVKQYYAQFASYPLVIEDGWHDVVVVDEVEGYCFDGVVEVIGNKVVAVPNEDTHVYPAIVRDGKVITRLRLNGKDYYWTNYFLDYIASKQ